MNPTLHYITFSALLLLIGCSQQKPDSAAEVQASPAQVSIDSIENLKEQSPDFFYEAIDKFSKDFTTLTPASTQLVDTLENPTEHWFLRSLEKQRKRLEGLEDQFATHKLANLPTLHEVEMVGSIRQSAFYISSSKTRDIIFEEWNFDTKENAERWRILLSDSLTSNEYTKPPRYEWVKETKLYLVSTRSAGQWFDWRDTLSIRLSGKTIAQLNLLYDPINLKHFKKWQGPANSTVINTQPHLFSVGGPHYSYFFFAKQRLSKEERTKSTMEFPTRQAFNITTSLHRKLTGTEDFNSIQETLVAVQCGINESALNGLDIVGKNVSSIYEILGPCLYEGKDLKVFGHSDRIVVVKTNQEIVSAFKYQRLNESFETLKTNGDMMQYILTFE